MNDLQIRTVTKNDQELLFEWINDSEVRKWSFNKEPISYEHHKDWFNRIINDNNILFLIFEQKKTPIGTVRFEKKDGTAILNYLISKDWRGKGVARLMLKEALKRIKSYWARIDILAYTVPQNIASMKSLEKSGFKLINNNSKKNCYIYRLK
ncbi:GNAT family N-acetyltransferase [Candidatus Woesearchaeota archaeon]|jgi:UDP-2,4-diacetamido-2,4,6-trideoxy-beta-L-altropyranose hydrolase|nr:GNAT family N-acetyltransferase [Candidatus Woesearchaeota archaeon]